MIVATYNCMFCGKLSKTSSCKHNKYCSNKCQGLHKSKLWIDDWVSGKIERIKRRVVRKWLVENFGNKCNVCGISEWQGNPITLWVDHKDGNASNNRPENFQLICPNCDSQQPTFGGKNYGNGRKSRGLPQSF